MSEGRDTVLRRALGANAVFTLICAGVLLGFGPRSATPMGLSDPSPLFVLGVGLIAFAGGVVWVSTRPRVSVSSALLIALCDLGWVAGSAVLLIGWSRSFRPLGVGLIVLVALVVGAMAVAQLRGARAIASNDRAGGEAVQAIEFARDVAAGPEASWSIVSDVHGYAAYAPTLSFSRLLKGTGVGAVRECGDKAGRWTETCTVWEEGRRYRFRVDTAAEDYPFPIDFLEAEWRVDEAPSGSRITMRFELTPRGGWLGELATLAMLPRFAAGANALFDNWEQAILAGDPEFAGQRGAGDRSRRSH